MRWKEGRDSFKSSCRNGIGTESRREIQASKRCAQCQTMIGEQPLAVVVANDDEVEGS
jgi:hypothetical protein